MWAGHWLTVSGALAVVHGNGIARQAVGWKDQASGTT